MHIEDRTLLNCLPSLPDGAKSRERAVAPADAAMVYVGLWARACHDADAAVGQAAPLLGHADPTIRTAAVQLLGQLDLPQARDALLPAYDDEDDRVVALALRALWDVSRYSAATFDALRRLVSRSWQVRDVEIGLWRPEVFRLDPSRIADGLALHMGNESPDALVDLLPRMSPTGRQAYASRLVRHAQHHRGELLSLAGDRSESVRAVVFRGLRGLGPLTDPEVATLERLLRRRATTLRRFVLSVLWLQPHRTVTETAHRLLAGNAAQAEAGRELLGTSGAQPISGGAAAARPAERSDDIEARVVDAETARGELATAYTKRAQQLDVLTGAITVLRLLSALGKQKLSRDPHWMRGDGGKAQTLSRLIRISVPETDDTVAGFAAASREYGVTGRGLVELAVYAPQWAPLVEGALELPGFTDGVYWVRAHTGDDVDELGAESRDAVQQRRQQEMGERATLPLTDLVDGAIDVEWLWRVLADLGEEGLDRVLRVAKYASTGAGHTRAVLAADAARGRLDRAELETRIEGKRHKDAVRVFGLLPLPRDARARADDLRARYDLLVRWNEQSNRYGRQRRHSEELAVRGAMHNLARTAGYRESQQLVSAVQGYTPA